VDSDETGLERFDEALEEASELVALRRQLEGLDYPITKADLLEQLDPTGIPKEALVKLQNSDTDLFHSVDHVLVNTQASF
jgi:hypothetical protein